MSLESSTQWLTFALAGDEYAVEVSNIREVLSCGPITRVPGLPPFLRGATNLRGRPLPVLDLATKLGLGTTELGRWTSVVAIELRTRTEVLLLGVLVDAVSDLIDVAASDIEAPPPMGTAVPPAYLVGLLRRANRYALLLDIQRALSEEELTLAARSDVRDLADPAPAEPPERI